MSAGYSHLPTADDEAMPEPAHAYVFAFAVCSLGCVLRLVCSSTSSGARHAPATRMDMAPLNKPPVT